MIKLNTPSGGSITLKPQEVIGKVDLPIERIGLGQILQRQYTDHTRDDSVVITSTSLQPITDLTVNITTTKVNSRLLIMGCVAMSNTYVSQIGLQRDGVELGNIPATSAGPANIIATFWDNQNTSGNMWWNQIWFEDIPGPIGTYSYRPSACCSWSGVAYAMYIFNRSSNDMDSYSTLEVIELEP